MDVTNDTREFNNDKYQRNELQAKQLVVKQLGAKHPFTEYNCIAHWVPKALSTLSQKSATSI